MYEQIVLGFPLLSGKHFKAINESVLRSAATPRWTALVVGHVKMHPHLFLVTLHLLTLKEPNQSMPVLVNGGSQRANRSVRKEAITETF